MTNSKHKNVFRILLILVLLGLILGGCSSKDQILGVWKQQDGDLHIRFHTGDFMSQRAYFGDDVLTLTGTYEIVNDRQIIINFEPGEWRGLESGTYDYTISGDILTLNDLTFERQPDVYSLE